MKKAVRDIVNAIKNEAVTYTDYVTQLGNECAYSDRMIEDIVKLAGRLARLTDNVDEFDREVLTPTLLERFLRAEVKFRLDEIIEEDYRLSHGDINAIAETICTDYFDFLIDYDELDETIRKLAVKIKEEK